MLLFLIIFNISTNTPFLRDKAKKRCFCLFKGKTYMTKGDKKVEEIERIIKQDGLIRLEY